MKDLKQNLTSTNFCQGFTEYPKIVSHTDSKTHSQIQRQIYIFMDIQFLKAI